MCRKCVLTSIFSTTDAKEKKKVSFQFPVDVKTNSGKVTGTGSVDLMDTLATLGNNIAGVFNT